MTKRFIVGERWAKVVPVGHGRFYVYDRKWCCQVGPNHRSREKAEREAEKMRQMEAS